MNISEPDWRVFKEVRVAALDRFCHRILDECVALCGDHTRSAHTRYLDLYTLIHQRNKEIQEAFDDPRRSTAVLSLMIMRQHGLVTRAELDRFSADTVQIVTRDF